MKIGTVFRMCSALVIIFSLVIAGSAVSCVFGNGGMNVSAMVDRLPADITAFNMMDVKVLRNDKDLKEMYKSWEGYEDWIQQEYGIDYHGANVIAHAGHPENEVVLSIYDGDFALEKVTALLQNLGYQSSQYEGQEVWGTNTSGSTNNNKVAPMVDLVTIGRENDLQNYIGTVEGSQDSLGDNADLKDVMRKLPAGIYMAGGTDQRHEGLKAWGFSIRKKDSNTLRLDYLYKFGKFEDEIHAGQAESDILTALVKADILPGDAATDRDVIAEGEYVKTKVDLEIRDFEVVFASFFPMVNGVDAANEELLAVQWAIAGCKARALAIGDHGIGGTLVAGFDGWDGRHGVVMAQSSDGTVIKDAADYLNRDTLKATYDIEQTGHVSQGYNISWRHVQWDGYRWIEAL